jgi:hypothetical protein
VMTVCMQIIHADCACAHTAMHLHAYCNVQYELGTGDKNIANDNVLTSNTTS